MTLQDQYSALQPEDKDVLAAFAKSLANLDQPVETAAQRAEVDRLYLILRQGPAGELAFRSLQNWQDFQDRKFLPAEGVD